MTEVLISAKPSYRPNNGVPIHVKIIAGLALVILLFFAFLNMGRVAKTYFTLYPADFAQVSDSESVRWSLSNLGTTKLIAHLNTNSSPDEAVFVFRMSDFGYYSNNRIRVFTDDSYAYLFEITSARSLASELRSLGIKYVAVPPYAVAEINNSAFGQLLGNTDLAQIVFDDQANRLYALIATEEAPELIDVWSTDFMTEDARNDWHISRLTQSIDRALMTKSASIDRSAETQSVSVSRVKPALARKDVVDVLQYSNLQPGLAPALSGERAIEIESGTYVFNADISGNGEISLYLDVFEQGTGSSMIMRKLLWSGVGTGVNQKIGGQFILTSAVSSSGIVQSYDARPYFTLRQGGRLSLSRLRIKRLALLTQQQVSTYASRDRALVQGWVAPVSIASTGYGVAPNFGASEAGHFSAQQKNSSVFSFSSPTYVAPSSLFEFDERLKLEAASDEVSPKVRIRSQLSGGGALAQSLKGDCLGSDDSIKISLQSLSLSSKARVLEKIVDLPCVPSGLHIEYVLRNDIFRSPPDPRFGEVKIDALEMSILYWVNAKALSEVDLTRSSEILLPQRSAEPIKPIYEDPP